MSFLKNIFGSSSEDQNESTSKMNWNALTDLEQLRIISLSNENQLLFSNTVLAAALVGWL
jgi:hypothetical protein